MHLEQGVRAGLAFVLRGLEACICGLFVCVQDACMRVCLKLPGETFCNAYISLFFSYSNNLKSKITHFSSPPSKEAQLKER